MTFAIHHCPAASSQWHQLETNRNEQEAIRRARNYALDNGGFVCVTNANGQTIYGTDPVSRARYLDLNPQWKGHQR